MWVPGGGGGGGVEAFMVPAGRISPACLSYTKYVCELRRQGCVWAGASGRKCGAEWDDMG